MKFALSAAAVAAVLCGRASGHMIMNVPRGYPGFTVETSPIDNVKYLFPCQAGPHGNYSGEEPTVLQAGGTQLLNFTGSAVHAGGSCQVSLAKSPSANASDWKVIHSIIGGCPATTAGNLPTVSYDAEDRPDGPHCPGTGLNHTDCVKSFDVPIPDLPAGAYVFAWSWSNNLGNREFYMNCASVSIAGGAGSVDFDALPAMFFSDVKGEPCVRGEGVLDYPSQNVGGNSTVEVSGYDVDKVSPAAVGDCYKVYGAPQYGGGAYDGTASSSASMTYPLTYSSGSNNDGASATPQTVASSAPPPAQQPAPATTTQMPSAGAPSAGTAVLTVGPVQTPGPYANITFSLLPSAGCAHPCSTEGQVVCIGTAQFGLCDHGCAVPQALAAGTVCSGGLITRRGAGAVPQPFEV